MTAGCGSGPVFRISLPSENVGPQEVMYSEDKMGTRTRSWAGG